MLISNNWKYSTYSPLCNNNSFEYHAITVIAPIKLQIVVIYLPPGQIIVPFLEELDGLLSSFGAFPLHGTARYGSVRFTFGGFSTGYCTWYLILF